ncbi:lipoprotein [uncultured Thalassospira sp.]|jgi:predicted small lipoprotein YifL|uniref:LPS translocon maturation chaperone LptM n=1 Tax=uncultured Thalassospira sp. TaxID=404382 RepID=UPI0030DA75FC|tara:strand:+ start:10672 stop:10833 length:162 start_codon:yes stop_codon:yes gene_type:complete
MHKTTRFSRLGARALMMALAITMGLSVAACGKKGPLEPPTEAGKDYPRSYPSQ